ncbi:MAG: porin [Bryobacteraceae bacterium]
MSRVKCFLMSAVFAGVTSQACAQTAWSADQITFSGLVDGYYSFNLNHPESRHNQLRNFDVSANQFSLNMAKLTAEHSAEPVGFRLDAGFGETFDAIHNSNSEFSTVRNIEQAYISLRPANAKGLQVDLGKFVTSAGAEVIETHSNWNYSRSLLFAWAIPYYHMGIRTAVPMGKHFTGGVQLVNNWNGMGDNNTGKTIGLTGTLASGPLSWANNYYVGPEKTGINDGWRHLYATTVLISGSKISAYVNFDYGADRITGSNTSNVWYGVAGALRFALTDHIAVAPRMEWFKDRDGFSTGTAQTLKEFTLTGEYKWADGVLSRLEYRRDWSDQPFFDRGAGLATSRSQDTVLVGFIACFGFER